MSKNKIRYIPIIIAVSIVAGIFIGTFYAKRFTDPRQQIGTIAPTSNKLNGLLRIINDQYVEGRSVCWMSVQHFLLVGADLYIVLHKRYQ